MPTLNLDRLADEGMTFFSFYGQPSCKPGRAACRLAASPIAARAWELAFNGRPPMTQNANSPCLDRRGLLTGMAALPVLPAAAGGSGAGGRDAFERGLLVRRLRRLPANDVPSVQGGAS